MASEGPYNEGAQGEILAPVSELQDYGATIISELDKAEAELGNEENQPISGMSAQVMTDIAKLRNQQFDIFRRHVEIEQTYKIQNAVADAQNVQRMSFSGIATTMRDKEHATAGLLDQLGEFDQQLRSVIQKFETPRTNVNHPIANDVVQTSTSQREFIPNSTADIENGMMKIEKEDPYVER